MASPLIRCFSKVGRQVSRPWSVCQHGLRNRSTQPDMSAEQAAALGVTYPPLQTYSEEEGMMRDAVNKFAQERLAPFVSKMDENSLMDPEVIKSLFEQGGMVVGARRTGWCQELQRCWVFHTQQFPVCIKNGPPPKRTSSQFDATVGEALESTWASIPCGTRSTPCRVHFLTN
ncbi:unnamed protein product [Oncorhynchus mykiss]|uniref:Acyl-CoA dehydrogenase/oxidase N-terminal domain-containing protein n=1 Tax=Oncorhynchus mykiss TaxID=8022 RepID=A0A060Z359_ONCMY|nr:unnamed protein product [Oncorhynchus mykiss]